MRSLSTETDQLGVSDIHKYTNTQIYKYTNTNSAITVHRNGSIGDIRYSQYKHIFNTSMYLKQIKEQGFAVELSWSFRGWHLHGGSCSWCMCNFVIFWLCNCVMCLGEINNHWIGRHALGATHTSSSKVRSPKSIKKLWLRWRLVETSNFYIPVVALGSGEGSVIRTITPHMMAVRPTFTGKTYQGEIKAKRKHREIIGKKSGDKFCSFPFHSNDCWNHNLVVTPIIGFW